MTQSESLVRRFSAPRVFVTAFMLLFTLSGLWALATPLMAVPDEPAHAIRAAAVVRGEFVPEQSGSIPWQSEVHVPRYVAHTSALTCFAFQPSVPASCQEDLAGDPTEIVTATTSASVNSPAYYAIVGLPTLVLEGDAALYAMRFVNVALMSALVAAAAAALSQLRNSRWSLLTLSISVTPMLLFLGGSINPNAIEVAAAVCLFGVLVLTLREHSTSTQLWIRMLTVTASAWMLVNTRSISMLWLVVLVATALLLADMSTVRQLLKRPPTWVALGLSLAACLFAFFWFTRPQIEAPLDEQPIYPYMGAPFTTGFQLMLEGAFDLFSGWIGVFGWLDTPAPGWTIAIWTVLLAFPVLAALIYGRGRTRTATALLLLGSFFIPPIVQGVLIGSYGLIWQGRYTMAIYVCLVIAAGLALDAIEQRRPAAFLRPILHVTLGLAALGHVIAFAWALRRYVIGIGGWLDMVLHPQWQPPLTWVGLTVLFLLALVGGAIIIARALGARVTQPNALVDSREYAAV